LTFDRRGSSAMYGFIARRAGAARSSRALLKARLFAISPPPLPYLRKSAPTLRERDGERTDAADPLPSCRDDYHNLVN